MIAGQRCLSCKNYIGGELFGEIDKKDEYQEGEFLHTCKAFPNGITEDILYGDNLHTEPTKDQGNDIVYEKA